MNKLFVAIASAGAMLVHAQSAQAALTEPTFQIFYDEAAFMAAAGTLRVEDFSDTSLAPGLGLTTTNGKIAGGLFADDLTQGATTVFNFEHFASAFGGTFTDTPGDRGLLFAVIQWPWSPKEISFEARGPFFGFISDYVFTGVEFQAGNRPGATQERYTIGDLRFNVVPEPTSWVLMVGGFGLAGLRLRRRSRLTRSSPV